MYKMTKQLLVPSAVYCLTCFAVAQLLYSIMLVIDPVGFRLSPRTWAASFIFVGTITTFYCSGGLAGLCLLICSTVALPRDHVKTAALIGAIASSVFFFGFTLAQDRLLLGATFVAATSAAIAVVVRTYAQSRIA
jgi:hypothetical protein